VTCLYTLSTQLIIQERRTDASSSTWTVSYYGHDGLGSTRALYNGSGVATDTYNYTAYGKMLKILPESGGTVNNYLFAGEQRDPDIKLCYNRARYLNVDSGRFTSRDTFEAGSGDTANLHRYLYVGGDPVNGIDPSGHNGDLPSLNVTMMQMAMLGMKTANTVLNAYSGIKNTIAGFQSLQNGDNALAALQFSMAGMNFTSSFASLAGPMPPLPPGGAMALAGGPGLSAAEKAFFLLAQNPALREWFARQVVYSAVGGGGMMMSAMAGNTGGGGGNGGGVRGPTPSAAAQMANLAILKA
jgi:RHS repeat-associated protein